MKQLRTLASAFLLCLFGVALAWAQAPTDTTPTADQILDRNLEAIGGRAAIEKMTSVVIRGTIQYEDVLLVANVEVYAKAPNKIVSIITIPGVGVSRGGFDGSVGWRQEPGKELRELQGEELESQRLDADFYGLLHPRQNYPQINVLGKDTIGTREVYVVEQRPARGDPRKLYFDVENGLLLRRDIIVLRPEGKELVENYFDDHREVEGRKFPFRLHVVTPRLTHRMRLTSIQVNVPIEDTIFAMPTTP